MNNPKFATIFLLTLALCFSLKSFLSSDESCIELPETIPGCISLHSLYPNDQFIDYSDDFERKAYIFDSKIYLASLAIESDPSKSMHDPVYCAAGKGWKVNRSSIVPIPGGQAKMLQLQKDNDHITLLYWYSFNGGNYCSFFEYKFDLMRSRLAPVFYPEQPHFVLIQCTDSNLNSWSAFAQNVIPWLCLKNQS